MKDSSHSSCDFSTADELLGLCRQHRCSIAQITLLRECREQGASQEALLSRMRSYYRAMRDSVKKGIHIKGRSASGLSGGDAAHLMAYAESAHPLLGPQLARAAAYGFAVLEVNAQFGRIVATPTAGSSGILPACLMSLEDDGRIDEQQAAYALFTAAGIGICIGRRAPFSGARGGCQAEVGTASAMAAAAVAEACSAPPESAIEAAAFALMNTLGMVCDPIGGYVEVPCVSRNGMFAVHSLLAATMALAGVRCIVPFDDVVAAMRDIGRRMPAALRETALGGLAQTPCGLKFPPKPVAVQPACNLKKKSSPFPERP